MEIEIITFVLLQLDFWCSNFRLLFFRRNLIASVAFFWITMVIPHSVWCSTHAIVGFRYLLGYMPFWWSGIFVWKCRQMWKLMLLDSQRREHLRSLASEEWILMHFLTCPWMNLSNFSMPVHGEGNIIYCFNLFPLSLGMYNILHATLFFLLPCSVCTYFLVVLATCERFYSFFSYPHILRNICIEFHSCNWLIRCETLFYLFF